MARRKSGTKKTSGKTKSKARPKKRGFLFRTVRFFTVMGLLAGLGVASVYMAIAFTYDLDQLGKMPSRSIVYDTNGDELGRLHGENRVIVPIKDVSGHFVSALLAREDNRFYSHFGVDVIGTGRAIVRNVKDQRFVQGASTITMQLARNSFGMTAKSLHRKLIEVALAVRLEIHLSKDEILSHYMNRIFFGTGIYGIEGAAQAYCGKPAKELTLDEAAMIAGIIRAPNRFSPFRHYDQALRERDTVIDRMVATERITKAEADAAKKVKTEVLRYVSRTAEQSWALDAVRRDLNLILDADEVEDGGLRIYTTIDLRLQRAAEGIVEKRLAEVENAKGFTHQTKRAYEGILKKNSSNRPDPKYLQGAMLVVDNDAGQIRAVVGGRDFQHSGFNRALLSKRQIGSTFKPFVYAAAVQRGLFPGTLIDDSAIRPGEIRGADENWSPRNSDGKFLGWQPAEVGLIQSRNTMTVRVGNYAGLDAVLDFAESAGLGHHDEESPQVYIGNLGATLKELTSAYSIFANTGESQRPFTISHIADPDGHEIFRSGHMPYHATSPGVSYVMQGMLADVMDKGTGAQARKMGFKSPAGGKTGTTNDFHDAWFVGFTERLTCGAWVGLDEPQRISSSAYGSQLALPLWVDVMKAAEKIGYVREVPRARPVFEDVLLCRHSGGLANSGCQRQKVAYKAAIPSDLIPGACSMHRGNLLTENADAHPSAPAGQAEKRSVVQRIRDWFR
jgi:penicillin-binding protein 1A